MSRRLSHCQTEPRAGERFDRVPIYRDQPRLAPPVSIQNTVAAAALMTRSRIRPPRSTPDHLRVRQVRHGEIGVPVIVVQVHGHAAHLAAHTIIPPIRGMLPIGMPPGAMAHGPLIHALHRPHAPMGRPDRAMHRHMARAVPAAMTCADLGQNLGALKEKS